MIRHRRLQDRGASFEYVSRETCLSTIFEKNRCAGHELELMGRGVLNLSVISGRNCHYGTQRRIEDGRWQRLLDQAMFHVKHRSHLAQ